MFGKIGDIVFAGVNSPLSESVTVAADWAEIKRFGSAPALHNTGRNLVNRSLDVRLHAAFGAGTVENQLFTLQNYVQAGKIVPYEQAGVNRGDVIVQQYSYVVESQTPQGVLVSALVTLNLLEYADGPNKADQSEKGFATDPLKVIPVRVLQTGTTTGALVSVTTDQASAESLSAIEAAIKARDNITERNSLLQKTNSAAKKAGELAKQAKETYDAAAELQAIAANLGNALQSVANTSEVLANAAESGDITNTVSALQNLSDANASVKAAKLPLDKLVISRKPI